MLLVCMYAASAFFINCHCLQEGGLVKVEVIIGAPQRGPYHLALRQANPGTFFAGILITLESQNQLEAMGYHGREYVQAFAV